MKRHPRRNRPLKAVCLLVASAFGAFVSAEEKAPVSAAWMKRLSLARDGETDRRLAEANRLVEAQRWDRAIPLYQQIIEGPAHFVTGKGWSCFSAREVARRRLKAMPPLARTLYREHHDPLAKPLWEQALRQEDLVGLAELASRYLFSSSGDDALDRLAAHAFDRGDFAQAWRTWERLLEFCPETDRPVGLIRFQMAVAAARLGRKEAAQQVLKDLRETHRGRTINLAGRDVPVERLTVEVAPPQPVMSFQGLGAQMGRFEIDQPVMSPSFQRQLRERDLPVPYPIQPVVADGTLYLQTARAVHALRPNDASLLWTSQLEFSVRRTAAQRDAVFQPAADRGRVFATLRNHLCAFDAQSGRPLWRQPSAAAKDHLLLQAQDVTPPLVTGGRVFLGAAVVKTEVEAHLAVFSAADGKEVRRLFLCSQTTGPRLGVGSTISPLAVSAGTVYVGTNLGAVAAVDAGSAEVRWVARYPSSASQLKDRTIELKTRWANNPVVVRRGLVLAAPQDSGFLLAFDARDGALRWRSPRFEARFLIAADERRVYVAGKTVAAYDLAGGKLLWRSQELPGGVRARPLLRGDRILCPARDGLVVVRTDDGTIEDVCAWRKPWSDPLGGPGNLLATSDRLIIAGLTSIHAYEDWPASRDRLAPGAREKPTSAIRLGALLRHRGQLREAHDVLMAVKTPPADQPEQVRRLQSARFAVLWDLAESARDEKQPAAEAWYRRALKHATKPEERAAALQRLGDLAAEAKQWPQAVGYFHQLNAEGSARVTVRPGVRLAADWYARLRIDDILATGREEPYARLEKEAQALLAKAQAAEDEGLYDRVVRRYPNSRAAEKAFLELAAGRFELRPARLSVHLPALAFSKRFPQLLQRLVRRLENAGHWADASRILLQLRDQFPNARLTEETKSVRAAEWATGRPNIVRPKVPPEAQDAARPWRKVWQSGAMPSWGRAWTFCSPAATGRLFIATRSRGGQQAAAPRGWFDTLQARSAGDGALLWQADLISFARQAETAGGSLIFRGSQKIIAVDPLSGRSRWTHVTGTPEEKVEAVPELPGEMAEELPVPLPPQLVRPGRIRALAAEGDQVFYATEANQVAALDAGTGKLLWQTAVDNLLVAQALYLYGDRVIAFEGAPAHVILLHRRTGKLEGRKALEGQDPRLRLAPLLPEDRRDRVFVLLGDRRVSCLRLEDGRTIWTRALERPTDRIYVSPDGRALCFLPSTGDFFRTLTGLDGGTGQERFSLDLELVPVYDLTLDASRAYVLGRKELNPSVKAVRLKDGQVAWESDAAFAVSTPTRLKWAGGGLLFYGDRGGAAASTIDPASGRRSGWVTVRGANYLEADRAAGTLCLATDRGIFGYRRVNPELIRRRRDQELASGQTSPARLAGLQFASGEYEKAAKILSAELSKQAPTGARRPGLWDRLAGANQARHLDEHPVLHCKQFATPPTIDGKLTEDWRAHEAAVIRGPDFVYPLLGAPSPAPPARGSNDRPDGRSTFRWDGPWDLSATLYLGWDAEFLYYAVEVNDSTFRVFSFNDHVWEGDGLVVAIDCANDGGFGFLFGDHFFTQGLARKPKEEAPEEDRVPGHFAVKLKPDQSGIIYECSIPWAYLRFIEPKEGTVFGFDILVTDDDGAGVTKALTWTPGLILHYSKWLLHQGVAPELYGDVKLEAGD